MIAIVKLQHQILNLILVYDNHECGLSFEVERLDDQVLVDQVVY